MVRRLVEANYFAFRDEPTPERVRFWLLELRTPELLMEAVGTHSIEAAKHAQMRGAVQAATSGTLDKVQNELAAEEARERELDRNYWAPLRAELEQLIHAIRKRQRESNAGNRSTLSVERPSALRTQK
ncbi:MAG: hypothetical protein ABIU86_14860 [Gemmatimonadaceae bacterium]